MKGRHLGYHEIKSGSDKSLVNKLTDFFRRKNAEDAHALLPQVTHFNEDYDLHLGDDDKAKRWTPPCNLL